MTEGTPGSVVRDLADIAAIEETSLDDRTGGATILDLFRTRRDAQPDATALIWLSNGRADDPPLRMTYAETYARIVQLANLMRRHGVSERAPVTLLTPNLPDMHLMLWAGAIAGVVNPINPFLNVEQIVEIMAAAGSRTIVAPSVETDPELAAKAAAVAERVPGFGRLFAAGGAANGGDRIALDRCDEHSATTLEFDRAIGAHDVALLLPTGGTIGTPKLVRQTHRNQLGSAAVAALLLDYRAGDRVLTGLPLFHTNAAIVTGLAAFSAGATVLLAGPTGFRSKETIRDFWRIVDKHRVSTFCAVPTVLASLLDVSITGSDVSSLRFALCGAAPLSPSLFAAFEERTGMRILEGYGLTESTALSTLNPRNGERRIGSIGLRVPYQQVVPAILDDHGRYVRACEIDEPGAILLHGPTITPGYDSHAHDEASWPRPGWINTGDLGRIDRDGYVWLSGRAKDIIIRGGHNIDPAIIENALSCHPAVDLAAGVGYPDAYAGELPMAFVVLKPGATITADALCAFARAHVVERAAAPMMVTIIGAMPLTAVGKIFKPALRIQAAEHAVRAALDASNVPAAVRAVVARHDPALGLVVTVTVVPGSHALVEATSASRLPLRLEIIEEV